MKYLVIMVLLVLITLPVQANRSEDSEQVFGRAFEEYTEDYMGIMNNVRVDTSQSYRYLDDLRELSNEISEEELPLVNTPYYDVVRYSFKHSVDSQIEAIENNNDHDLQVESRSYLMIAGTVLGDIVNSLED